MEEIYIIKVTGRTKSAKVKKDCIILLVFHKDCLCRQTTLYVNTLVAFLWYIIKFQKWLMGGALQNNWPVNQCGLLKILVLIF